MLSLPDDGGKRNFGGGNRVGKELLTTETQETRECSFLIFLRVSVVILTVTLMS